jgi:hypothetical protein
MQARTSKIETAAGTITTRTARRFIAVESREATFVARSDRFVRICAGTDRAAVEARAIVEAASRKIEGEIVVDAYRARGEVVKRTDSFATAKAAAAKVGGFVFDTETGERI